MSNPQSTDNTGTTPLRPRHREVQRNAADLTTADLTADPWSWWREQMPITRSWAYLDHAAVGPLSAPAASALRQYADEAERQGDTVWPSWSARAEALRSAAAELLSADKDEMCLLPNTSTGINVVAEGFPWRQGDSVVLPEGEFPSNLFPWQNQQHRGVELRVVPRGDRGQIDPDDLFARVDGSTRIIALSWVGYASGFRADLKAIVERAKDRGVLVFLDAIQGLGVFDLDLSSIPIDFLAADGHKWLLGPEGMGIGFIRREHLGLLRCTNVGWASVRNTFNYAQPQLELRDGAARFEPGSANMGGAAALAASVELFNQVRAACGPDAIGQRVVALASELAELLQQHGIATRLPADPANRSGIVTFDVPDRDPAAVRKAAMEHGCVVSCRGGGVRASVHAYNDASELQRFVAAVASA